MSQVFELIQSMTPHEKRYFKQDNPISEGKKKPIHLQLFDALNKMNEYNRQTIEKKYPPINVKEKLLYDKLLKSLRDYHSTDKTVLVDLIKNFDILYKKGLIDLAKSNINNAKRIAEKLDDQAALLELNLQERLLHREERDEDYLKKIDELPNEKEKILNRLNNHLSYFDIYDKLMSMIVNKFRISNEEDEQLLNTIEKKLVDLSYDEQHQTTQSFLYNHKCYALLNQLRRKRKEATRYYEKTVEWWEENNQYKKLNSYQYIISLSNLINAYHTREYYFEKVPSLIKKIEKIEKKDLTAPIDENIQMRVIYLYKLSLLMNQFDYKAAEVYVLEIENGIEQYKINDTHSMAIYGNICILFFLLEKFEPCHDKINKTRLKRRTEKRQDIQRFGHLITLICMLETNNTDDFLNKARNVKKLFKNKHKIEDSSFECKMLALLEKNYKSTNRKNVLKEMMDYFDDNKKTKEANTFGFSEISYWVESKLTKESIIDIMKKNQS